MHSHTGAMRDVFEDKKADLDGYLKAFQYVPHQKGILVMINGRGQETEQKDVVSQVDLFSPGYLVCLVDLVYLVHPVDLVDLVCFVSPSIPPISSVGKMGTATIYRLFNLWP